MHHRMDLRIRVCDLGRDHLEPVTSWENIVLVLNLTVHECRTIFYLFRPCLGAYTGLSLASHRFPETR